MKCNMFLMMLVVLIIATAPQKIYACSCAPPPPPAEAFARAEAVFMGKINSLIPVPSTYLFLVKISVLKTWKGNKSEAEQIYTARDEAACGYPFTTGATYVIYAYRDETRTLRTGLCVRTAPISKAEEDLKFLNSLPAKDSACCGSSNIVFGDAVLFLGMIIFLIKRNKNTVQA